MDRSSKRQKGYGVSDVKVMFLDESGDHTLKYINPAYPLFVLGGVIIDRSYVRSVVEPDMRRFKQQYFGRDDVILHTVEMRNGTGNYAFLADPTIRTRFYSELNGLLLGWDYTVVACVINKSNHLARYGAHAADPYHFSLDILIERFCWVLNSDLDGGFVCAEKRGEPLDRNLMNAWEHIRTRGTGATSAVVIDERIVGLDLRDKKPNLAGLQLADLVITPIGRHVAGQTPKPAQVQWSVVERKLRRQRGSDSDPGFVIRP